LFDSDDEEEYVPEEDDEDEDAEGGEGEEGEDGLEGGNEEDDDEYYDTCGDSEESEGETVCNYPKSLISFKKYIFCIFVCFV
jgi:hypothetical protein